VVFDYLPSCKEFLLFKMEFLAVVSGKMWMISVMLKGGDHEVLCFKTHLTKVKNQYLKEKRK